MPKKKSKEPIISEEERPVLDALVQLRKVTGLSQEDAARLAATSGQTVYNWERGQGLPAWAVRVRYMKALARSNRTARSIVLRLLGLPTLEEQKLDRQVAEFVGRMEAARREPGWDHLAYTLNLMLPQKPGEERAAAT